MLTKQPEVGVTSKQELGGNVVEIFVLLVFKWRLLCRLLYLL